MRAKGEVLIRKPNNADILSKRTTESLNAYRKQRLNEAFTDNDFLYLKVFFNNISISDLITILFNKMFNHIRPIHK